jgi:hypothetical protein
VLEARLASLTAPSRVDAFARRAGMVPAEPLPADYLRLEQAPRRVAPVPARVRPRAQRPLVPTRTR